MCKWWLSRSHITVQSGRKHSHPAEPRTSAMEMTFKRIYCLPLTLKLDSVCSLGDLMKLNWGAGKWDGYGKETSRVGLRDTEELETKIAKDLRNKEYTS